MRLFDASLSLENSANPGTHCGMTRCRASLTPRIVAPVPPTVTPVMDNLVEIYSLPDLGVDDMRMVLDFPRLRGA